MPRCDLSKFALHAHTLLSRDVRDAAEQFGLAPKTSPHTQKTQPLSDIQHRQLTFLSDWIAHTNFERVIQQTALSWFFRLCALRFMTLNDFLPQYKTLFELRPASKAKFCTRFLNACHALHPLLPDIFQPQDDPSELLLPAQLLHAGDHGYLDSASCVVLALTELVPETDFILKNGGLVENLGWLYQYYISEKHAQVVDPLYGKFIQKEDITITKKTTTATIINFLYFLNTIIPTFLSYYNKIIYICILFISRCFNK